MHLFVYFPTSNAVHTPMQFLTQEKLEKKHIIIWVGKKILELVLRGEAPFLPRMFCNYGKAGKKGRIIKGFLLQKFCLRNKSRKELLPSSFSFPLPFSHTYSYIMMFL